MHGFRRVSLRLAGPLLALLAAAGCAREPEASTELLLSAAASLGPAMTELAERFQARHPGVMVRGNYAASGTLAQQILNGARVDLFVSAAEREMDLVERGGLLEPGTRRVVASNRLVLVVPAADPGRVRRLAELADPAVTRVAIGAPASVPAGAYAVATLRHLGLWEKVAPRTVQAATVRQALAYVERGEVDAALVYATDALGSTRVRVVDSAPPAAHPPIVYPAALVAREGRPEEARALLDFLSGEEAAGVLRRFGFLPPGAPPGES